MNDTGLKALILKAIGTQSRNEFCKKAKISPGNFSRILRGQRPSPEILLRIAETGQNVSYEALMEAAGYIEKKEEIEKEIVAGRIPIYGGAAAGSPIEAVENYSGYIELAYDTHHMSEDTFALKVVGDSMDLANIPDGSVVIIARTGQIKDGEIGAVLVNGEATIKRIYQNKDHLVLAPVSRNPVYQPQIYLLEDDVRILGKVIYSLVDIS
ncbi:MAG: LexA family protein [Christensenellaceae bacterium]|jgi:SOS-response transcriptional repressor LexA